MSSTARPPRTRSPELSDLAESMTFPRGDLAEQWQAALERALAPRLARLEAEVTALRDLLDLVAPALDFPCRAVGESAEGQEGVPELAWFVPGDAVEHPGRRPVDAMVFTYRYDFSHGACYPDAIANLEQGLGILREDLLETDPRFEAKIVELLEALPAAELETLEARRREWDDPLAEREVWMRRTMEALLAYGESD